MILGRGLSFGCRTIQQSRIHSLNSASGFSSLGVRSLSYSFDGSTGGGSPRGTSYSSLSKWPVRKTNTILNIVPQGQKMIVERFGKLHSVQDPGFFIAVPFVDDVAYVIDVREQAIDIPPQSTITRDNVSVDVSGNLFMAFVDPQRAAYGATNPIYAAVQHAQSAMRSAIGEMELDEILHERARLNNIIKGSVQEAAVVWGLDVRRYEITEITPDAVIRHAMDKQAAAERSRREQVLQAEGDKKTQELTSEGLKISLTNESEGNLIKVTNEANGEKIKRVKEAQGEAESIQIKAAAQAEAIKVIAEELKKPGGTHAANLALARDYVAMYGEMGSKSNTLMFNERPADMNALLTQAAMALGAATNQSNTKTKDIAIESDLVSPADVKPGDNKV